MGLGSASLVLVLGGACGSRSPLDASPPGPAPDVRDATRTTSSSESSSSESSSSESSSSESSSSESSPSESSSSESSPSESSPSESSTEDTAPPPADVPPDVGDDDSGQPDDAAELPPVSPRNLLADGGFESGLDGWQAFGAANLRRSTDAPRSGDHCLLATARSDDWVGLGWPLEGLAVPGTEYEFGVWVRIVGELDRTGIVDASTWTTCQSRERTTRITGAIVGPSWTQLLGTFVVPDCAPETLTIVVDGPPAGVSFCIDDARLARTR